MIDPRDDDTTARPPRVSTVVACHDVRRWRSLVAAVGSLRDQVGVEAEVIVAVDNNHVLYDKLRAEDLADRVVLNEGPKGASVTRNAGAALAASSIIAFLDDDARADRGWLGALVSSFVDGDVAGAGGLVAPAWLGKRPAWFPDEFGWVVGASFTGMPSDTAVVRNVWAENMAIRREVFRGIGGFRATFGKVGSVSQPEDTELCIRATAAFPATRWIYEPRAVVHHEVPEQRSSFSFFLRRCQNEGRGKANLARLLRTQGTTDGRLHDENRYVKSVLPRSAVGYLRGSLKDPKNSLRFGALTLGISSAAVGYVRGSVAPARDEAARAGVRVQWN
jgi:glycosyltransferase involved in cell wall biosynthesis